MKSGQNKDCQTDGAMGPDVMIRKRNTPAWSNMKNFQNLRKDMIGFLP